MTLTAESHIDEPRVRVTEGDARTALSAVMGKSVIASRARLRFGPGRTCEPIARLLDRAIVQAEGAGLDPELLVVADGRAQVAEDIVRVRRSAFGMADWIRSPTCRVHIVLRRGLYAAASADPYRRLKAAFLSCRPRMSPQIRRTSGSPRCVRCCPTS